MKALVLAVILTQGSFRRHYRHPVMQRVERLWT